MADKSSSTVYIGNLDERVSERVLYDILIQAGRVVDLYIPRDKETGKSKNYAFAEYESEEIADYAVKLFSGLVTLYRRTLKFAVSGQDKSYVSFPIATASSVGSSLKPRPYHVPYDDTELSAQSPRFSTSYRLSDHKINFPQVPCDISMQRPNRYGSYHDQTDYNYNYNYNYSQGALEAASNSFSRVVLYALGGSDGRIAVDAVTLVINRERFL